MTETQATKLYSMMISSVHPSMAGHFPGNPIVPGVVILDHLIRLWQSHHKHTIVTIKSAKFIHLLRPDIDCCVSFIEKPRNSIAFLVEEKDTITVIAKGLFSYRIQESL